MYYGVWMKMIIGEFPVSGFKNFCSYQKVYCGHIFKEYCKRQHIQGIAIKVTKMKNGILHITWVYY